jgi:ubiquinone/menaquinone biosynthesis C-methylase UbiE
LTDREKISKFARRNQICFNEAEEYVGNIEKRNKFIRELMGNLDHSRILDCGTGDGGFLRRLAKNRSISIVSIDNNITRLMEVENSLSQSKIINQSNIESEGNSERKPVIMLINSDLTNLPLKTNLFDISSSYFTLHEIDHPENISDVISETVRVTKNGGRIMLFDYYINNSDSEEDTSIAIERTYHEAMELLGRRFWGFHTEAEYIDLFSSENISNLSIYRLNSFRMPSKAFISAWNRLFSLILPGIPKAEKLSICHKIKGIFKTVEMNGAVFPSTLIIECIKKK